VLPGRATAGALLMASELGLSAGRRLALSRRIRWLVAATISYNVVEAIVALTEGTRVSSTALIGFGLDSVIEVSSAAAVAWQFAGKDPEAREKIALRIIAFSFFGLALYVTVDAIRSLFGFGEARHSIVGIGLATASLVVMPVLSWAQRRAGRELGSLSAVADSKQTLLCTYLSAILLLGLLLNSLFGWSWADPIAALGIAAIAAKEGINTWKGDACCPAPVHTKTTAGEHNCDCCTDDDLGRRHHQRRFRARRRGAHVRNATRQRKIHCQ
jgi:divalent metal cation (Fe/Co/Zn/Cd) transporter